MKAEGFWRDLPIYYAAGKTEYLQTAVAGCIWAHMIRCEDIFEAFDDGYEDHYNRHMNIIAEIKWEDLQNMLNHGYTDFIRVAQDLGLHPLIRSKLLLWRINTCPTIPTHGGSQK